METLRNFHIVLVDDDSDDRLLFAEAAEAFKNIVFEGMENGVVLMKSLDLKNQLPDMIFLDLNMPEKDGRECLLEIRKSPELKDLPVIVFSTSSNRKDIEETFELGANLYVTKPNSFTALKKIIGKVLNINWEEYKPKTNRSKFVLALALP